MLLHITAQTEDLSLYTDKQQTSGTITFTVWLSINYGFGKPINNLTLSNFELYPSDGWQTSSLKGVMELADDSGFYGVEIKRFISKDFDDDMYLTPTARMAGLVVRVHDGEKEYRGQVIVKLSYQPQ